MTKLYDEHFILKKLICKAQCNYLWCGNSLILVPHPCIQYSLVMVMLSSFAYDVCAWAL